MTEARTTPYANCLFEQPWWLDIVAPGQWDEVIIEEKGRVIARMPYVKFGSTVKLPPYTQNMGIWMASEIRKSYAKQKKVINEVLDALAGYKSVRLQLPPQNDYVLPYKWRGYEIVPHFTYRLEDLSDLDAVFGNFSKKCRKNIRGAMRTVAVNNNTSVNNLWRMINATYSRQNMKPSSPKNLIEHIVTSCEALGHGKYFEAVDDDGNIHSASYFVYDEQTCYDLMGGSDKRYNQDSCARNLIIWESIKFAAAHSRVFDFEGSNIEGIEHFFQQFGGRCTPYYSVRRAGLLYEARLILQEHSTLFRKTLNAAARFKRSLQYR